IRVEDRVGVRRREIHLDIGLDLAIGARRPGIEEETGLLAGELPFRAARMAEADRCGGTADCGADPEGVRVERDRRQIAGAALAVRVGLIESALAVQRAA